ncbi:hypothetical protein [Paraburkholderia mimosarum]|uniref:hypothetical protein n=1 Tax=Paraburkholderia mimosarum TaxID=312026 RepID=UPI0003F75198|nr:hypothetical protein [Paraburkholderia mimosarum]
MTKGLVVLALMAYASLCLAWGSVATLPNRDGGEVRLTDRPCNSNTSSYGMAYATGSGAAHLEGCWTLNVAGDVDIHWWPRGENDFWRTYERSHFSVTKYGRANGWE